MIQLPQALRGLARYNKFLLCKLVPERDGKGNLTGKMTKHPLHPGTLRAHNAGDPAAHLSADAAIKMLNDMGEHDKYKLGYYFSADDPFFFLDIDGAWNGEAWSPIATELCQRFAGAALEVSQSGTGLHIIGTGYCPPHGCRDDHKNHLELYTRMRFVCLGLNDVSGDCNTDHTKQLAWLVENHFQGNSAVDDGEWNAEPVSGSNPIEDDEVLVNKALLSKSAAGTFGAKATFKQLWEADEDALGEFYPPDNQNDAFNKSQADMALAQHLAFWTGNNHERINTLMRKSALMREKWDDRKGYYLPMTIRKACSQQASFYNSEYRKDRAETDNPTVGNSPAPAEEDPSPTPEYKDVCPKTRENTGSWFDTDMKRHWDKYVVVLDGPRVVDTETMIGYDQAQFKAKYGGIKFIYGIDGKPTDDAWKALVHNQHKIWIRVHCARLDPTRKPQKIFYDEELKMDVLNTYIPHEPKLVEGDVGPFTSWLELLIPDDRDRDILLSYSAALVQNPGVKFRYAIVLQGTQGTGKSTFAKILEYCIGKRYTYYPKAKQFTDGLNKFNEWMGSNFLTVVEEIRKPRPGTVAAADFDSQIKTFITQDRVEVEGKGVNQRMENVTSNYLFITNEIDDFPILQNDRRYTPIHCAQQSYDDLVAAGMDDEYFRLFFNWFENEQGLEKSANFLMNYQINDEFNPLMIARAPRSSMYDAAVAGSLTWRAETLRDGITENFPGLRGGWMSTMRAREYLKSQGIRDNAGKQLSAAIKELGYIKHPYLPDGRSPKTIVEDGGTPYLYVKKGSLLCGLKDPDAVVAKYCADQGYTPGVPEGAKNFAS